MKNIGIYGDDNTAHSLMCLQEVVLSMDFDDVEMKTKDFILLLKNLPESLLCGTVHEEIDKYDLF